VTTLKTINSGRVLGRRCNSDGGKPPQFAGAYMRRAKTLKSNPTFNQYQSLAQDTALYTGKGSFRGLCYILFKLAGESGEVLEKMGKMLRGDEGEDYWDTDPKTWPQEIKDKFKKETGDVLWYLAGAAQELDMTLQEIAETNLEKLQSRQERGVTYGSGDER
jgi:NTP pyrophosphatase (non-canonical NTP hydrolase)